MAKCNGCGIDKGELVDELCGECREELGLMLSKLPVQRPPGPCRRCSGREIIQALLRERGASGGDYVSEYLRPLAITHGLEKTTTFWSGAPQGISADLERFAGALVAYVCRSCGHTELYALDPGQIPIGPEHGTRLLKVDDEPYR